MTSAESDFRDFRQKMEQQGIPEIFIRNFKNQYVKLQAGQTGLIAEKDIEPVQSLPDAERLSRSSLNLGNENLQKTIFLKLNGGLGTSMGLEQVKSLLTIKDHYTFLDIIARQALTGGYRLLLMDSFSTQKDTLDYLKKYPDLGLKIPLDFLQHKEPKVKQSDLKPVEWPQNPTLEWCPPGHGDLYLSISSSGILDLLLDNDYQYAFISNADNLGAVLDPRILGHFIENDFPFMMEVADRTEADKKGGHLAQLAGGQFILREIAQCPEDDITAFQDVRKHQYFNTNNLWLNLPALQDLLRQKNHILDLPMIRNQKPVDPRDPDSEKVFQIETAAGSAIQVFSESSAIRVSRSRFSPVKNTNDLLAVRSDYYRLTPEFRVEPRFQMKGEGIEIDLDNQYYKLIDQFEERFPEGVPSLVRCRKLTIRGDIKFGRRIELNGEVSIINKDEVQAILADGLLLEGDIEL